MVRFRVLLIFAVALVSCKSSETKPKEKSTSKAVPQLQEELVVVDAAPKRKKLLARADVEALVEGWLNAQNQGDFAAYSALFADEFRGVRRSGKRTVRLDRKGWLSDRSRMFRKKMTVSISQLEVSLTHNSAAVRFTQEWASGSYRDLGKKMLRIASTKEGLQISGEEMLSSKLLRPLASVPLLSNELVLLHEGMIVLSNSPDAEWGRGPAVLETGELTEYPAHCDDDPPDYEQENGRYFACADSAPSAAYDLYKARQSAFERSIPADLVAWKGKKLTLYTAENACGTTTVGDLSLWAAMRTTTERAGAAGSKPQDVAQTILAIGSAILASTLAETCGGEAVFARAEALPAPPLWSIERAGEELTKAATAELSQVPEFQMLKDEFEPYVGDAIAPVFEVVRSANNDADYLLASWNGPLNCHEDGAFSVLWRISNVRGSRRFEELYTDSFDPLIAKAALDVTGDGIPEIITSDGLLAWDEALEGFDRLQAVGFEVSAEDPCHCECE